MKFLRNKYLINKYTFYLNKILDFDNLTTDDADTHFEMVL